MYKVHTSRTHIKSLVMINQSLLLEINEDHNHEQGVYVYMQHRIVSRGVTHIYVTLQVKTSLVCT